MSNVIRLAVVDPNDSSRESFKTLLGGIESLWLEAECDQYDRFVDVVGQTTPEVAVISLDVDAAAGLALVGNIKEKFPSCGILVISSTSDGQTILQAMRAGAKEFLTLPVQPDEFLAAIHRICHTDGNNGSQKKKESSVIAVCGATGGVGCTSIAINLGCTLSHDKQNSVVLVDLDLGLGDADIYLDSIPEYTLADVSQNISRLDVDLLRQSLTQHASDLYLLPRPVKIQDTMDIRPEDLHHVFKLLKSTFSHLILDLSKSYNELDLVALRASDHVLLIAQLDLPCLRNIMRLLASFADVPGLLDKVKIVVNRFGLENGSISMKKAQESLGHEFYWKLPNDYNNMVEVRNNGVPLITHAPKASITQSFIGLVASLEGRTATESTEDAPPSGGAKVGRWLNFWPPTKT